jgi:hypothetical protein
MAEVMRVSLKTEQRRCHTAVSDSRPWVRRAEGYLENSPSETLQAGVGETSPPGFAAPYLHSLSRILFVFCFEREPHDLFL